ncbi:MAG: vWA domain-containing protein [Aquificaceae bacterium]
MKEKWRIIEKILSEEYGIELQGSYEGWGAGYDPRYLPLTEMWAKGELEDIPEPAKKPAGVVFYLQELSKKPEEDILNSIRHQIEYLFTTDLFLWKLGQREFYRFGFAPTNFLVLYALLESIRTDYHIIQKHPSSQPSLFKEYETLLREMDTYYPHHLFALGLLKGWLGKEPLPKDLERFLYEYLRAESKEAYQRLIEELFGKYMAYIERSQDLNYIDLLLEEARGKVKREGHKGRIMTDLLKKLPESLQAIIQEYKEGKAIELPEEKRREILKNLRNLPDWMKDYIKQMSYIDIAEKDLAFIGSFLPKTLEVDIEHRGFLSFLIKGWEEEKSMPQEGFSLGREKSQEDRLYEGAYGMGKEEFKAYKKTLSKVLPYVEALKKKLRRLMPLEEEAWGGKHFYGKRLNHKALSVEVPLSRGRIYMKREQEVKKELAFKLLIDISTSMKREEKINRALEALILFSEVIDSLRMPFSIDLFSDKVIRLKDFSEDYKMVRGRILELLHRVGGGTNLEKALLFSYEDIQLFCTRRHIKGCMIVCSDGEPTRGLRGQELKSLINQMKAMIPMVGIGVGLEKNYIDYYFEATGIKIRDLSDLPMAFTRIIENQARRLLSFQ